MVFNVGQSTSAHKIAHLPLHRQPWYPSPSITETELTGAAILTNDIPPTPRKLNRRDRQILKTLDFMVDLLLLQHEEVTGKQLEDSHFVGPRHHPQPDIAFSNIVMEKFWLTQDAISRIPDPDDTNPVRAAVKASLIEQMIEVQANVWNRLHVLNGAPARPVGRAPDWTVAVLPSPVIIWLIPTEMKAIRLSEAFAKRNIMAAWNFMFYC